MCNLPLATVFLQPRYSIINSILQLSDLQQSDTSHRVEIWVFPNPLIFETDNLSLFQKVADLITILGTSQFHSLNYYAHIPNTQSPYTHTL